MRICHWILLVYVVVSILALAAIPLSAAGWITPDPLSAIPALLLGVPSSYAFTSVLGSQSAVLNFVLLALAMAANAFLIWLIGAILSKRQPR